MAKARIKPVAGGIEETLRGMLEEYTSKPITGGITVDGHKHWWFLEFGTGKQFDPEGDSTELARPAGISSEPGGFAGDYPIEPKAKPFTMPNGKVKYPKLSFYWRRKRKWVHFKIVRHPGQAPKGMVRLALREFRAQLFDALNTLAESGVIPRRKDLVDLVNTLLLDAVRDLRRNTPTGSPVEDKSTGDHLKTAWEVVPAK